LLFALLFLFAVSIDLILNLDNFVDKAREVSGEEAGFVKMFAQTVSLALNFQGPRLFQFYAYLHGLVAVGAMGFTLSLMHRHRELVAIMASGVSLHRVAMPFIVAAFALSLVQLVNQEMLLPKVAPLLLRGHGEIGQRGVERFAIGFTADRGGNLLHAPSFDPITRTLEWPTFIQRDAEGRTVRRTTAERATWVEANRAWMLVGGRMVMPTTPGQAEGNLVQHVENVDQYPSDLTPEVLMVRRYSQFAAMLSMGQISRMLDAPLISDRNALLRHYYSRFASVIVTLLVVALSLPCFLLREPANLLKQSMMCASVAIPATVGSAMGMLIEMPGIPPAVGVFLPVIVLGFTAIFPWTLLKT
jgi:lipopolysaccharide export system permease protein